MKVRFDEGFSMRATAQGFDEGLTLARVDKPLEEAQYARRGSKTARFSGERRCPFDAVDCSDADVEMPGDGAD